MKLISPICSYFTSTTWLTIWRTNNLVVTSDTLVSKAPFGIIHTDLFSVKLINIYLLSNLINHMVVPAHMSYTDANKSPGHASIPILRSALCTRFGSMMQGAGRWIIYSDKLGQIYGWPRQLVCLWVCEHILMCVSSYVYSLYAYVCTSPIYNVNYLLLQRDFRHWYRFATSWHRPVSPAKCIWNDAATKHICWYWQMQKYNPGEWVLVVRMFYVVQIYWFPCWKRFKCGVYLCPVFFPNSAFLLLDLDFDVVHTSASVAKDSTFQIRV